MFESQLTYHDIYSDLMDWGGSAADETRARQAKRACVASIRNLAMEHNWSYYVAQGSISTDAAYTTGTVTYVASTKTVTLSGGTFPNWVDKGFIRFNDRNCEIYSRESDTEVILSTYSAPADDVSSGVTYGVYRDSYSMPVDFLNCDNFYDHENSHWLSYCTPDDFKGVHVTREVGSPPRFYTFLGDSNYIGGMAIHFYPAPGDEEYTYNFIYTRHPKPLSVLDYKTGTVTVSGGSATVTGTSTAWNDSMVGCIIRFTDQTDYPTGPSGDNPATEERIITAVNSATELVLDAAVTDTYTTQKYRVSSLVDIDPAIMLSAVQLGAEREMARIIRSDSFAQLDAAYSLALLKAKESDSRFTGGSDGVYNKPNTLADVFGSYTG